MNDQTSDRSQGRYEQFRTFQQEARTRADAISRLRPSESEAVQRIGRLFTAFRTSRNLDHEEISERTGVALDVLQLLEQGFIAPEELSKEFLARVGLAFSSSTDRLVDEEGGVFASIAMSMLEAGRWVGSEDAIPEVDRLIRSLEQQNELSVREEAAWNLGEHVLDSRARDALSGALTNDDSPLVRMAALESLAAVAEDPAISLELLGRLADTDPVVRSRAAEIVSGSISETQSGLARALSKLTASTEEISEALLDWLRRAVVLVPSMSIGLQLKPRLEGAASHSVIGVDIESERYNAELIMNGDYPEFGLALGITFEDAPAWAGHSVRVQFASDVEDDLGSAGWRVEWEGLGPDVVDSETPVSAFGRVEMLLGTTSRPEPDRGGDPQRNSLESLVTVIARALNHEDAISRLESVDQGR